MNIQEKIGKIRFKLAELKSLDKNFNVFGARKHQYELKSTKSEDELVLFENENKIQLPEVYREFLKQVGNDGAGSYYGLGPLEHGKYEDLRLSN